MTVKNHLILPCEIAVKSVVPAIRAAIAKELVEKHGLRQAQAAEILGISQSAVSKYTRHVRGHVIEIDKSEGLQNFKDAMINLLVNERSERAAFLGLFCQICVIVRKNGLMCPFCLKTDSKIRLEGCDFCLTDKPTSKQNCGDI